MVHRFIASAALAADMLQRAGLPRRRRSHALLVVLAEAAAGALAHKRALHRALQWEEGSGRMGLV